MATTSIWRVRGSLKGVVDYVENEEKTTGKGERELQTVISYASDGDKTQQMNDESLEVIQQFVTGINCDPELATQQMLAVKRRFGKEDGTIAYHGYQSFAPGEATPELAHEIGIKLAQRLWGDRYQVVVATHLDKESHLHSHFVLNTVSFKDGIKFHRTQQDYQEMRRVSDELCREYGLSVIQKPHNRSKNYREWQNEREGQPTLRSSIRADIDRAILASTTDRDFIKVMTQMGYDIQTRTETGAPLKYPKLKPPDTHGFFRFHKLGEGYSLNEIRTRILGNIRKQNPFPEAEASPGRRYRCNKPLAGRKVTGLRALYFYYCYQLHSIARHPTKVKRVSFLLREDIIKLSKLDAQMLFLGKNRIGTMAELEARKAQAEAALGSLLSQRKELRNQLRRCLRHGQTDQADAIQADISSITGQLSAYRKEIQMCNEIAQRSIAVATNLALLRKQQEEERKESEVKKARELLRRRG